MAKVYPMIMASETRATYMHPDLALNDRKQFVYNLGVLLSQTREGIVGAYLDDQETVHVVYKGGHEELINVNMDSYMAIVRDVTKGL